LRTGLAAPALDYAPQNKEPLPTPIAHYNSLLTKQPLACYNPLPAIPLAFRCSILQPTTTGTAAGQDLNLSLDRVNSNRNFTNKLWNAGKFVLFQLEGVQDSGEWARLASADFSSSSSWQGLCLSDRWILSSLHQVGGGLSS
jgi:hypothetical protein